MGTTCHSPAAEVTDSDTVTFTLNLAPVLDDASENDRDGDVSNLTCNVVSSYLLSPTVLSTLFLTPFYP